MLTKVAAVTGANGFIGSRLCRLLKAGGCRIAGVGRNPFSGVCDATFLGDISQEGPWSNALDGADTIFHLAGKAHALSEVKQDDAEYLRINTEGTRNVLEAARRAKVKRFVFFSSIKAMSRDGRAGRIPGGGGRNGVDKVPRAFTEEDIIAPDSPYGISKLEAEKLVLLGGYVPEPGVVRLCMVYGAGTKGNMQKMLAAVRQHRFPPLPEVANCRSMVHVQDVLQAAILASEHPHATGQIFIVSDGCAYSTRQIYELMCQALGRRPSRWSIPLACLRALGRAGDAVGKLRGKRFLFDSDAFDKLIGDAWFSSRKIETILGFKPQWNLAKAMPEMVEDMERCGNES